MRRGVTLVEIMVVVAIIGLMAGISFPAVSSGLDSIRLHAAADSVSAFLNAAMNRADRRQEVIEVIVDLKQNRLVLDSSEPGYNRTLELPRTIVIAGVTGGSVLNEDQRHLLLLPNGSFPRFEVDLANARGVTLRVAIDPITGAPNILNAAAANPGGQP